MATLQEQIDFVIGPQVPIGSSYFDQTQVSMAKVLGQMCPAVPPADPTKLNEYALHLQYYDLPKSLYTVYRRTNDPLFLQHARNAADSFWQHPWIGSGTVRPWPDNATPPPRHVGIGGFILRALDERSEMWDFCVAYTKSMLNTYMLWRLNNAKLHVDIREGAFTYHFATWLAKVLPDSYPKQGGGTWTNGAEVRAQLHADLEKIAIDYYERLQRASPCGSCWLYDAEINGQSLKGFTQPFTVGLLLLAFADFHQITTNAAVRESLKGMILRAARHLYADGPYRLNDPVPYDPTKRWRCFWYLWHGGTVANPTEFEKGGWSLAGTTKSDVQDGRQSIGPVIAIYGKAYQLSGDPLYLQAFNELWDSAYGETDGIKTYFNTDGKGFNQHCARAGSGPPWAGMTATPGGGSAPIPAPAPSPTPSPTPPTTKPIVAITSPLSGAVFSGKVTVNAAISDGVDVDAVYLIVDDLVTGAAGSVAPFSFPMNTVLLTDGAHSMFVRAWDGDLIVGDSERVKFTVSNEAPAPAPTPAPAPAPAPTPIANCGISANPSSISIPRNGSGVINVTLSNLTQPVPVNVLGSDGQVTVSPLSRTAAPTSAVLAFQVRVKNKKQSRVITFNSSCGSVKVNVNVT